MTRIRSLRRTALAWITVLLAVAGLITTGAAYRYNESETAGFLDGQLRQIALNAGPGLAAANAPAAPDQDPEDSFAVTIWDAAGHDVHQSPPGVDIHLVDENVELVNLEEEEWLMVHLVY